jgi:uncharacterized repeat protein (TIGR03803 family)
MRSRVSPMRRFSIVLALCLGTVLCGITHRDRVADVNAAPQTSTSGFRTLYRFQDVPDGAFPSGGMAVLNGVLYGTTKEGGSACGCGIVFQITADGTERVLYSFKGGEDGRSPAEPLFAVYELLYGATTFGGGDHNRGTVFAVDASTGEERVLHRFSGGDDGAWPAAGVTSVGGVLYGTTAQRGLPGCDIHLLPGHAAGCGTIWGSVLASRGGARPDILRRGPHRAAQSPVERTRRGPGSPRIRAHWAGGIETTSVRRSQTSSSNSRW